MQRGWKKVLLWSLLGLTVYLTAESALPAAYQPSARLGVLLIHGYQATGSKLMASGGVHCRYQPTCSHYAEDAISYYGTVGGVLRTCGRLWRCSPWGGTGYDPAVEERSAAYMAPQQETPEERKAREDAQKRAAEDLRKAAQEWDKAIKGSGTEAGKAAGACAGACITGIIWMVAHVVIMVIALIFVWKDSKARGDPNQMLWLILVFVLSWIGAIAYFVARPKGDLTPCPLCHQHRLSTLAVCPHCKNAGAAPPAPPQPPQPS